MHSLIFYSLALLLLTSSIGVIVTKNTVHSVLFLISTILNVAGLFILLGAELLAMMLVIVYVGAVAILFLFIVMMLDVASYTVDKTHVVNRWEHIKKHLSINSQSTYLYLLLALVITASGIYIFGKLINTMQNDYWLANYLSKNCILSWLLVTMAGFIIFYHVTGVSIIKVLKILVKGTPTIAIIGGVALLGLIAMIIFSNMPNNITSISRYNSQLLAVSNTHSLAGLIYNHYAIVFIAVGLILLTAMIGTIVITLEKRKDIKRQDIGQQLSRNKQQTLEIRKVKSGEGI